MKEEVPEKLFFSPKHFYLSAWIGGPLMAGAMAGYMLWTIKLRWKASAIIIAGLVLSLLLELMLAQFARFVLFPLNININFWVIIIALLSAQLLFAYFISLLLRIKNLKALIFPAEASYYGRSQCIGLVLLNVAYLLVHADIPILFAHFPNMILLIYIWPHIYFYNRIKHLFVSPKQAMIARWVVVIIACYMPLAFALSDLLPEDIMNIPQLLAEYYIYTLLYLFLLLGAVDLLGQTSLRFHFLPAHLIRHRTTKLAAMLLVFCALIVILISGNKRYNHIVKNEFSIQVPAQDTALDSLCICFVADMHLNNFTSNAFIENYVEHIEQIKPDIILYGGDMVERSRISEEKLKLFNEKSGVIKAAYGKYIVGGNHDNYRRNGYDEERDLFYLSDTLVKVADAFYLMGLRYRSSQARPIAELKKMATENLPLILLDHAPYQLEDAYENNIDIQLSGHTHYGQVWPINYIIQGLFEIPRGYEKIKETHFFVTSGIQGWGTPIRTAGRSEIMVIRVQFKD
jgi:predicted MPP superfamily phosphohydrolase